MLLKAAIVLLLGVLSLALLVNAMPMADRAYDAALKHPIRFTNTTKPVFMNFTAGDPLDARGFWMNKPAAYALNRTTGLSITSGPRTDFWQRTYYGYRADSGPMWLLPVKGNFSLEARMHWTPSALYDQTGLYVRVSSRQWIKTDDEFTADGYSMLGVVVTNLGYSDWSYESFDSTVTTLSWQVHRRADDFFVKVSRDGVAYREIRMTHLFDCPDTIAVGIYVATPLGDSFTSTFDYVKLSQCSYEPYVGDLIDS